MGIVYTAMGPAREQGRQAACMSNLRQIGQALQMYRADYDGADATGQPMEWWALGLPPDFIVRALVSQGYIKDKRILHCPSEHDPESGRAFSSYTMDLDNWLLESRGVRLGRPPFREVIAKRGERLVVLHCSEHNFPASDNKPNLKIVLRLNGEVNRLWATNEKPPWHW